MLNQRYSAHAALLGVALIYGANFTIAKEILNGEFMGPMALVFFRIFSGMLFFLAIHVIFIREKVEKKDLLKLAVCSIFGVVINQSAFITGLKYTSPINASVLMVTTPMLVLLIAIILRQEYFSKRKAIGILIGATGTLLLIFGKGNMDFSGSIKGDLLVFFNAFAYALYLVMVKPLMQKYSPLTIVKWIFIFGLIPVIPMSYSQVLETDWSQLTPGIWMAFIYVLVFTTFFSYLLNAYALKIVKPSTVGVYIYLQPVLASIIALSLGKDQLTWVKILAGLAIIAGVYLVSKAKKPSSAQIS